MLNNVFNGREALTYKATENRGSSSIHNYLLQFPNHNDFDTFWDSYSFMYSFYYTPVHHCYKEIPNANTKDKICLAEWWPSHTRDVVTWADLKFESSYLNHILMDVLCKCMLLYQCSNQINYRVTRRRLGLRESRKLLRSHRLRVTGTVGPSVGKHFGSSSHSTRSEMGTHSSDECVHSMDVLFWRVWTSDHCLGFDWKGAVSGQERETQNVCSTQQLLLANLTFST